MTEDLVLKEWCLTKARMADKQDSVRDHCCLISML